MRQVTTGSTDQTIVFYAYDSDGVAVDLDSGSAGLTLAYRIDQNGREGTPVSMTPVARLTANVHRDGAITSRGDGKHEVDLPDAAFATNQSIVTVEVDTTDADVFFAERIVVDDSLNELLDRVPTSGDYILTVTVTDASTDDEIEGATITLSRTGQRSVGSTNASGVATIGVDAATWTYVVRAGGYASKTGTVVVSANQSLAVQLDAIIIPASTGDTITAYYICLDEEGQPQSGVDVCLYADEVIDADSGIALSGVERTVTSDANGYATFTNVPTGYQYVVTVGYSRQYRINLPAASTSPFAMRPVIR